METVHEAVRTAAAANPGRLAVIDQAKSYSYADLVRAADAVSANLRARNISGGIVGVHLPRSASTIAILLGVLSAGAAYLPIDPKLPLGKKLALLEDSSADLVIGDVGLEGAGASMSVDESFVPPRRRSNKPSERRHDNLAYVIYTSGSTGTPKGVRISHSNLSNLVRWHCDEFSLGSTGRVAQFASLSFDASVWEIWPCLVAGAELRIVPEAARPFPSATASWLADRRITQAFLPTSTAENALPFLVDKPGALKVLLTGGDRLTRFRPAGFGPRFVNAYGPTEATVLATAGDVPVEPLTGPSLPTLGRPISNVAVHVLDDELRELEPGTVGELCISGAGVASGYLNRDEETATRFVNWQGRRIYRTGDRGTLLPSGEFAFEGRDDHQVKIRGQRTELGDIEAAVRSAPGVKSVSAVATRKRDEVVGFVLGDDTLDAHAVRAHAATILARDQLPRIVILQELPITENGKIDRHKLEKLASDEFGRRRENRARSAD